MNTPLGLAATLTPPIDRSIVSPSELDTVLSHADEGRSLLTHPLAQMLIEIREVNTFAIATLVVGVRRSALIKHFVDDDRREMVGIALHATEHSPMVLARFLGVVTRPNQTARAQFTVDREAFVEATSQADADVLAALEASGVDATTAATIGLLMVSRRASWQVSCVHSSRSNESGGHLSAVGDGESVSVFDAGPGGLWTLDVNDTTVTVSPVNPHQTYLRLVSLFPQAVC
jgi:hypothetical protein